MIKENVITAIYIPDAQSVCASGPQFEIQTPVVIVALDFLNPEWRDGQQSISIEGTVHGFLFLFDFLSAIARDYLFEPLGGVWVDFSMRENETNLQQYDNRREELLISLEKRSISEETLYQLSVIDNFANSITLLQP